MEVIIRADSNKKIGIGHIIRAKNLGIFFRDKNIKSKIITRSTNVSSYFSNFKKNEILFLKKKNSFLMEKKIILNIFKKIKNKKKIFIIDLLNYTKYISLIKQLKKNHVKIILICDHKKKVIFPAELIVNANPCQLRYKYNSKKITYLVGPKYIIMDKSYLNKKKIYFKKKIKKILLTVGGTDQKNLIFSIIQILENYDLKLSVSIFTTSASHYLKQLRNILKNDSLRNKYKIFLDKPNLSKYWQKNDMAITAGGNTLYERISSGTPGVSISQFSQQTYIANEFEKFGYNINIKGYTDKLSRFDDNKILKFILDERMRKTQYNKISNLEINNGTNLLYFKIKNLFYAHV